MLSFGVHRAKSTGKLCVGDSNTNGASGISSARAVSSKKPTFWLLEVELQREFNYSPAVLVGDCAEVFESVRRESITLRRITHVSSYSTGTVRCRTRASSVFSDGLSRITINVPIK